MSSHAVQQTLSADLDRLAAGALVVAFSGGLDSTVLLHALASLPAARTRGLRALHIDHGLHADSAAWAERAAGAARELDVALEIVAAGAIDTGGVGLE